MKTKTGYLRQVEVKEFGNWRPLCLCYKYELSYQLRSYLSRGGSAIKCRVCFCGRDNWSVGNITDFV